MGANKNKTYEFIGKLALALFSQGIKMSFSTLMQVLVENGYRQYGNEHGMARGLSAAYSYWKAKESGCQIPTTCGAIANTFVKKDGEVAWA